MIISHKHKFIFIKTYKTAGTSIEIWLSTLCGAGDIITPVSPRDEVLRKERGGLGPQNYYVPKVKYGISEWLSLLTGRRPRFFNHMAARQIVRYIDEDIWRTYFKFCFERNPWDRILSYYHWRYRTEPRPTLDEFLWIKPPKLLSMRGYQLYTIDSAVVADKVYQFEHLDREVTDIASRLGVESPKTLPRSKTETRTDRRSYREILGPQHRAFIAELSKEEIALFGYEF